MVSLLALSLNVDKIVELELTGLNIRTDLCCSGKELFLAGKTGFQISEREKNKSLNLRTVISCL